MITILLDLPQKWRSNPFLENLSHIIYGFLFIPIYDNHILAILVIFIKPLISKSIVNQTIITYLYGHTIPIYFPQILLLSFYIVVTRLDAWRTGPLDSGHELVLRDTDSEVPRWVKHGEVNRGKWWASLFFGGKIVANVWRYMKIWGKMSGFCFADWNFEVIHLR
jgi:hypothetical protein